MGTRLGKIKPESKQTVKIAGDEYAMIKSIWRRIEFEPKVHGTGFYLKFFAKHPQYIKYFLNDPSKDDFNPDALMVVKFTVIIEVLGYLILDFHNKPKQFHQLIGYIGMIHKDMNLSEEDTNNMFTALIDYLKDAMSDLMTDACELVFVAFFRNIRDLMMESIAVERHRFADQEKEDEDSAERSRFKALVPCAWFDNSNKLIYGQSREYWMLRQQEWKSKMKFWEQEMQAATGAVNVQTTIESTSSEEEVLEQVRGAEDSDVDTRTSYPDEGNQTDSSLLQRAKYLKTGRLVSIPHFDQLDPDLSDTGEADEIEENYFMDNARSRAATSVKLTPRERHRAVVSKMKTLQARSSRRLISSTDTASPREVGPLNLNDKDYAILKKMWSEVETNPQKYSRGIYMRFFLEFPQYLKYFIEEKSASWEDAHRINDKFPLILSTLGYLIIDFYKKPTKFDSILDYVALIHQDMYLKVEDFNNFAHVIIKYFTDVMPDAMTDECAKIFAEFTDHFSHQLVAKMVKGRSEVSGPGIDNRNRIYYPCRWFEQRDKAMYGFEQSYWTARRKRWANKIQRWETEGVTTDSRMVQKLLNRSNADVEKEGSIISASVSQTTEPHTMGSAKSETLNEKLHDDNKKTILKTNPPRSRSPKIQTNIDPRSTAAAIVSAGLKEVSKIRQPTPRERFRSRRNYENDALTSNNQAADPIKVGNEKLNTEITARQGRHGSSADLAEDKTDH